MRSNPFGRLRRAMMSLLVVVPLVTTWTVSASAHVTYPRVQIDGGGWGHGRGMGQYGALGYARDHGWGSRRILDHFYGGTTQGPASDLGRLDPNRLKVQLASMNGRYPAVALASGRMVLSDSTGRQLRTVTDGAVRFLPSGGGFALQVADSCAGPWHDAGSLGQSAIAIEAQLDPGDPADDELVLGLGSDTLLAVCGRSYRTWYDGEIWAQRTSSGTRTINVVTVEQYLRGVVPNEVPASWPAPVLEAQAVAARSYVLAGDRRWGTHADTCDNTYCQVYDGRYTTRGGHFRSSTHGRTDAATAATAGQVRLRANGSVARTEFSSSTGGHTAGGDFPAVVDVGDSVSANPNSTWTVDASLSGVESRYGLGPVQSIEVTERDGHGRFGGRALEVRFEFERGSRILTGSAVRRMFGLKSDLFDFGPVRSGPDDQSAPSAPDDPSEPDDPADPSQDGDDPGPDVEARKMAVVDIFQRLAGRPPSADEIDRWLEEFESGGSEADVRLDLATALVNDEPFAGALLDQLYQTTFGRRADANGHQYWLERLTTEGSAGLSYEQIGTFFYGSPEYFRRAGNSNHDYVAELYADLLGRPADQDGLDYWLEVLDRGSPSDVVASFYRSVESRRSRAAALYRLAAGRNPSPQQVNDGAELLLGMSDLDLAARYGAAPDQ